MKITKEWLKEHDACIVGYEWSLKVLDDKPMDAKTFIGKLMGEDRFNWANWVIVRLLTKDQNIAYAIFAAELVLDIYEKQYPDDKRPRNAIEASRKYLQTKTAYAAAAAYAADAAADAADAAAYAAYAAYAARAAAAGADAAARAADTLNIKNKIVDYGLELIGGGG